jgi:hypothetical protein
MFKRNKQTSNRTEILDSAISHVTSFEQLESRRMYSVSTSETIYRLGQSHEASIIVTGDFNGDGRVDADLPTFGSLCYAGVGAQQSIWVPIIEKAFAFFRKNDGNYSSIESGPPSESFSVLGQSSSNSFKWTTHGFVTQQVFWHWVSDQLNSGKTVAAGTSDGGGFLAGRTATWSTIWNTTVGAWFRTSCSVIRGESTAPAPTATTTDTSPFRLAMRFKPSIS